jgi:SET domain-containing protein
MPFHQYFGKKVIKKPPFLYAGTSTIHGLGVFTGKSLKPGEIIEKAPIILINEADSHLLGSSLLYDYYFMVGSVNTPVAIGLGFSSLYNHSAPSNASYRIDIVREQIIISACRFIPAGEEITINYNGHPEEISPVSFTKRTEL